MKNCSQAFFLIFIDVPDAEANKIKAEVKSIIGKEDAESPNLYKHVDFCDLKAIADHFKLNE